MTPSNPAASERLFAEGCCLCGAAKWSSKSDAGPMGIGNGRLACFDCLDGHLNLVDSVHAEADRRKSASAHRLSEPEKVECWGVQPTDADLPKTLPAGTRFVWRDDEQYAGEVSVASGTLTLVVKSYRGQMRHKDGMLSNPEAVWSARNIDWSRVPKPRPSNGKAEGAKWEPKVGDFCEGTCGSTGEHRVGKFLHIGAGGDPVIEQDGRRWWMRTESFRPSTPTTATHGSPNHCPHGICLLDVCVDCERGAKAQPAAVDKLAGADPYAGHRAALAAEGMTEADIYVRTSEADMTAHIDRRNARRLRGDELSRAASYRMGLTESTRSAGDYRWTKWVSTRHATAPRRPEGDE